MNDVSRHEVGSTKTQVSECRETTTSPQRAIFDLRVWVEANTADDLFRAAVELTSRARAVAPEGVDIRYTQLRRGHPLCAFKPTLEPKRSKGHR